MEPWRAILDAGDAAAAWDLFIDRYRRLILATIRRTLDGDDDLLDVFSDVCQTLSADHLTLPKRHPGDSEKGRFSTWLVAIVHNQTIDWLRRRHGRRRVVPPPGMSAIQQQIFEQVFIRRSTHAEAYERVRAREAPGLSYGAFLKEVAATYRAIQHARSRGALHYLTGPPPGSDADAGVEDQYASRETSARLEEALGSLRADERLAVQLFVVDDLPAAEVARLVGWADAKSVYNRVYRALERVREHLVRLGVGPSDI